MHNLILHSIQGIEGLAMVDTPGQGSIFRVELYGEQPWQVVVSAQQPAKFSTQTFLRRRTSSFVHSVRRSVSLLFL